MCTCALAPLFTLGIALIAGTGAAFIEKRPPHFPGRVPGDLPSVFPWWEEPEFS